MEEIQEVDTRKEHQKLCQLRGIIVDDVEELNDLKETKLMAAAAEGRFTPQHSLCIFYLGSGRGYFDFLFRNFVQVYVGAQIVGACWCFSQ